VPERTVLYRMFNAANELLYVGISAHPTLRMSQHATRQPWWHALANITMEHFPSHALAAAAETKAIKTENPRFNVVDNPYARVMIPSGDIWEYTPTEPPKLIGPEEAGKILECTPITLRNWAKKKQGPKPYIVNKRKKHMYDLNEVHAFHAALRNGSFEIGGRYVYEIELAKFEAENN